MPLEFRIRWQREGRQPTHRIFQGWDVACRKVSGLKALDDIKAEFSRYADMPDLVDVELQVREVGQWRRHDYQPPAQDCHRESMRDHARWREPELLEETSEDTAEVPF